MTKELYYLWTSDFAPQTFDEIPGNHEVISAIKRYFINNNVPNIILSGNNGTCKSTIARLIAQTHLGDKFDRACLRIDGSIHRGKDIITANPDKKSTTTDKNKYYGMDIMSFAKTRVTMDSDKKKIIIIYNFDHMTDEAQNALRRIIETYNKKNRFILVCNSLNDIIEPIQSRCVCLQTREIDDIEADTLMKDILGKKNIHIPQDILDTICLLANGDVKKTINYLQLIANTVNPTLDKFYKIFNAPPVHVMKDIINCCQKQDTHIAAYEKMQLLLENGHNYCDILEILMNTLTRYTNIDKKLQIAYLQILTRCYHTAERTSSTTHIYNLLAEFCLVSTDFM